MKKIVAMLLSLMLELSCIAVAEGASNATTVAATVSLRRSRRARDSLPLSIASMRAASSVSSGS